MSSSDSILPPHGGYRKLKSFQVAQLTYDVTVQFCDRYISKRSRTHDQMVQAARSGVQNIVEGSKASGTSKKTEIRLTGVARASLEELRLDYEDYLRQRELPTLPHDHPILKRFKARKCKTVQEVRAWVHEERERMLAQDAHGRPRTSTDGPPSMSVPESPCESLTSAALVANAALSLINLASYLLGRQLEAQVRAFEKEGGFSERLYQVRKQYRSRHFDRGFD